MTCFVDTSALLAILDEREAQHSRADRTWQQLLTTNEQLVTTNYVVLEVAALAQRRLGLEAIHLLQNDLVPLVVVHWIDEHVHQTAVAALLTAARRSLSLVDCTSFEVMRMRGIHDAFVFDAHFAEQGFTCRPNPQLP